MHAASSAQTVRKVSACALAHAIPHRDCSILARALRRPRAGSRQATGTRDVHARRETDGRERLSSDSDKRLRPQVDAWKYIHTQLRSSG
eukprot:1533366-Pleurochrysis_carterae.AAC.4